MFKYDFKLILFERNRGYDITAHSRNKKMWGDMIDAVPFKEKWEAAKDSIAKMAVEFGSSPYNLTSKAKKLGLTPRPVRALNRIVKHFDLELSEEEYEELSRFLRRQKYDLAPGYAIAYLFVYYYLQRFCARALAYNPFMKFLGKERVYMESGAAYYRAKQAIIDGFGKTCSVKRLTLKLLRTFCENHPLIIPPPIQADLEEIMRKSTWTGVPLNNVARLIHQVLAHHSPPFYHPHQLSQRRLALLIGCSIFAFQEQKDQIIEKIAKVKGREWLFNNDYVYPDFYVLEKDSVLITTETVMPIWVKGELLLSEIADNLGILPVELFCFVASRPPAELKRRVLDDLIHHFQIAGLSPEAYQEILRSLPDLNPRNSIFHWSAYYYFQLFPKLRLQIPLMRFLEYIKTQGYRKIGISNVFQRKVKKQLTNLYLCAPNFYLRAEIVYNSIIHYFESRYKDFT